mgnify:CR=1 FL=1
MIFNIMESRAYKYNRMTLKILFDHSKRGITTDDVRKRNDINFRERWLTVIGDGTEQQIITFTNKNLKKVTYSEQEM